MWNSIFHHFYIPIAGQIHLNGLRTALFNYLFAKANDGTFIVRMANDGQQPQIFRHLDWAGIQPDESAIHGGEFGPYIQSQRLEIYQRSVKQLLENGSAYYCFCTEKRLEQLRDKADEANETPTYDNRCRDLTPLQVAEKLANKDTMCIRYVVIKDGKRVFLEDKTMKKRTRGTALYYFISRFLPISG